MKDDRKQNKNSYIIYENSNMVIYLTVFIVPVGIRTHDVLFLSRMRWRLFHAAKDVSYIEWAFIIRGSANGHRCLNTAILWATDWLRTGLPDFSWHNIPKWGKIYQIATKLPNGHKMYQMAVIYSKCQKIIPTFFTPRPSKIDPNCDFWSDLVENSNCNTSSLLTKIVTFSKSNVRKCRIAKLQIKRDRIVIPLKKVSKESGFLQRKKFF
jgi:hypothetical protein